MTVYGNIKPGEQLPPGKEQCIHCGATWDGDGRTLYCPVCGTPDRGKQ